MSMIINKIHKYRFLLAIYLTIFLTIFLAFLYSSLELHDYRPGWGILFIPSVIPLLVILIDVFQDIVRYRRKHFSRVWFIIVGLL